MTKFEEADALFIQKLLHEDYHDCKIIVFDNVINYISYILFKYKSGNIIDKLRNLKYTLTVGCSLGVYTSVIHETHILNFNIRKYQKDNEEYAFAQTVFHELRHYWQDKMGYFDDPYCERDAIKFHLRMIEKEQNRKLINNYFSI